VSGYTCDRSKGQCTLAAPGQGDSLANCEESCSADPPPTDTYECDVESFTCKQATNKLGQTECDKACSDETPAALVGQWRGLNVQTGFPKGEFVAEFTETTLAWGPYGNPRAYVATVATIAPMTMRLTLLSPASELGTVLIATYGNPGYPTGPETISASLAIQTLASHQAPPVDVKNAMGDTQFDVYVMFQCTSWGTAGCDFSAAFETAAVKQVKQSVRAEAKKLFPVDASRAAAPAADSCNAYTGCDDCLADASGKCGWCDGEVTDTAGNVICGADGNGCCGGNDGFSFCNVAFRKTCPVTCDYTDWINPTCRAATSKEINAGMQTYENCEKMPWCTNEVYVFCDTDETQCRTVYSKEECDAEPMCDSANPAGCDQETCKKVNYIFCDPILGCTSVSDKGECDENPYCDSTNPKQTCDPTKCTAQLYYTCDATKFQCTPHTGPFPPTPYFNTTDACEAECVSKDVSGVWRGLRVDAQFVADEWDFSVGSASIAFKSKLTGQAFVGTYVIGDPVTPANYLTAAITVTLNTGEVLKGVVSNDRDMQSSLGPVTKFLYLALPIFATASVASFDAGMAAGMQEFVLVACLDDGIELGCDFSKAYA
jgi:hypothetical protein